MSEVVAQLRELITEIDKTAVMAMSAQEKAREACGSYQEAATGTDHPEMRSAVADARTAGEKAGKVARLLAEAANAFSDYLNEIAPGSAPSRRHAADVMPTGEDLWAAAREEGGGKKFGKFTRKLSNSASDLGGAAKNLVQFVERIPPGSTGTVKPATEAIPDTPAASPSDLVGQLIVVGAIAAAVGQKIGKFVEKKRGKTDDRSK